MYTLYSSPQALPLVPPGNSSSRRGTRPSTLASHRIGWSWRSRWTGGRWRTTPPSSPPPPSPASTKGGCPSSKCFSSARPRPVPPLPSNSPTLTFCRGPLRPSKSLRRVGWTGTTRGGRGPAAAASSASILTRKDRGAQSAWTRVRNFRYYSTFLTSITKRCLYKISKCMVSGEKFFNIILLF